MRRSRSALVFSRPDGSMMRADVPLECVLRRAMGRAGLTTGYIRVCRAQGCRHLEPAPDGELRRCPKDGRKLWPKPQVRPLRFHDLRHTTASLLLLAGVPLVVVQRVLRHRDPKLTERVYRHSRPATSAPRWTDSGSLPRRLRESSRRRGPRAIFPRRLVPPCGPRRPGRARGAHSGRLDSDGRSGTC
jgi:hypothetical protein